MPATTSCATARRWSPRPRKQAARPRKSSRHPRRRAPARHPASTQRSRARHRQSGGRRRAHRREARRAGHEAARAQSSTPTSASYGNVPSGCLSRHSIGRSRGACDELLNTLRPTWDEHAAAVAEARSEISSREQRRTHFGQSGSPKLVECWQQLPTHLDTLNQIAAVARQFGPSRPLPAHHRIRQQRRIQTRRLGDLVRRRQPRSRLRRVPPARHPPPIPFVRSAFEAQHARTGTRTLPPMGLCTVGGAA